MSLHRAYASAKRDDVREPVERAYLPDLETSDYIQYLLTGLCEFHRALIVLRFFEGMSFTQMADITGMPKSTVIYHMNQALEECRRLA